MKILIGSFILFCSLGFTAESPEAYRNYVLALPAKMIFSVNTPMGSAEVSYGLQWDNPLIALPAMSLYPDLQGDPTKNYIEFFDRIALQPGSYLKIGELKVPLACIWVHGQDNREISGNDPLVPSQVYRYILVANDFTCTGPINPGWPENGLRKEMWDTYIEIVIKDLTIYHPTDATLRYRWNESRMVVKDVGPKQ